MKQHKQSFCKYIRKKKFAFDYLLYLPENYGKTAAAKWPLLVFLHGQEERGRNLDSVKKHGLPKMVEEGKTFPFVMVSPQCPLRTFWHRKVEALQVFLNDVSQRYPIDASRIYLTGISMGGFGVWHWAAAYPRQFAALVPICGGTEAEDGFPARVKVLKDVPIWAFHGAKDRAVPVQLAQILLDLLKAQHGKARLTVYPDGGHDVWTHTYQQPELYDWLLAQKNEYM